MAQQRGLTTTKHSMRPTDSEQICRTCQQFKVCPRQISTAASYEVVLQNVPCVRALRFQMFTCLTRKNATAIASNVGTWLGSSPASSTSCPSAASTPSTSPVRQITMAGLGGYYTTLHCAQHKPKSNDKIKDNEVLFDHSCGVQCTCMVIGLPKSSH